MFLVLLTVIAYQILYKPNVAGYAVLTIYSNSCTSACDITATADMTGYPVLSHGEL